MPAEENVNFGDGFDVNDNHGGETLTRFVRHLKQVPTSSLERDISELLTDLKYLEDQFSFEPELYEKEKQKVIAEMKVAYLRVKLRMARDEYESRVSAGLAAGQKGTSS